MLMLVSFFLNRGMSEKMASAVAHLILIALVILAIFASYLYAYEHGRNVEQAIYVAKIKDYEAQLTTNAEVYAIKEKNMTQVFSDQLKKDQDDYRSLQDQKQQVITITKKEMVRYVPKALDKKSIDDNIFTAGWLYQYNRALSPENPGLPTSGPGDVGAATGIATSDVAANATFNYSEAVARGKVINLWQRWYKEKFLAWKDFVQSQPVNPELPK